MRNTEFINKKSKKINSLILFISTYIGSNEEEIQTVFSLRWQSSCYKLWKTLTSLCVPEIIKAYDLHWPF